MWLLKIENVEYKLKVTQKYQTYKAAEKDFLYDLKCCREADMLIQFSQNDNQFIARKNGKHIVSVSIKEL